MSNDVYVIAGPTAAGKTARAIELAQQLREAELINIDSRQIYRGLDIGTNKGDVVHVSDVNLLVDGQPQSFPLFKYPGTQVAIHLLSFLDVNEVCNAFEFRDLAYQLIADVLKRGKTPILVGGSGLYLSVILHPENYTEQSEVDLNLRDKLNSMALVDLQTQAQALVPYVWENLNHSDRHNPRRLVRIIEKSSSSSYKHQNHTHNFDQTNYPKYKFIVELVDLPMAELTDRINSRVDEMFAQGLVNEVKHILGSGISPDVLPLQGMGYKEAIMLLDNEITGKECIRLVKIAHRQYAKRQKTWFKKYLPEAQV